MAKRLFDLVVSGVALVLLAPVFLIAAASIRLSSPGPILFRAPRVGRGGTLFVMHKFRTMRQGSASGSPITGARDPRVFLAGRILRSLKIDELPQLYDVFAGRMSIVGPRPEDPRIVERHYTALGRETLTVLPGLASPGSIYNYTHGDTDLDTDDPEASYVANLLPIKLALELVYVRRATLAYDVRLILRTAVTIAQVAAGRRRFPDPAELDEARRILEQGQIVVEAGAQLPVN
jgi:lipopolysaccharide/colanic/teichoic acid biosynthesis glycosyltransferase